MNDVWNQLHTDAMERTADGYDSIKEFKNGGLSSLNTGAWLYDHYEKFSDEPWTPVHENAHQVREAYRPVQQWRYRKYPRAEGPRNKAGDEVFAGHLCLENRSWVVTVVAYNVSEVGDVRYAGDPTERTLALLQDMKANPRKPTAMSECRTQRKSGEPQPKPKITKLLLNSAVVAYNDGLISFDAVWAMVFEFQLAKANRESRLRERGDSSDAVTEFLLSMRQGILDKTFEGKNGAQYTTFLHLAWHRFKIKWFDKQQEHDDMFESLTPSNWSPAEDQPDEDEGKHVIPADEQFVSKNYQRQLRDAAFQREAPAAIQKARAALVGLTAIVVEDMADGKSQLKTAEETGLSRHAIGRMQRKFKEQVKRIA